MGSTAPGHKSCGIASSFMSARCQAALGEPQPTVRNCVRGSGWGCWDVWSEKTGPSG